MDDALIAALSAQLDAPTHQLTDAPKCVTPLGSVATQTLAPEDNPDLPYRHEQHIDDHWVISWQLPALWQTKLAALTDHLLSLNGWQRIKAVVQAEDGWYQLNFTKDSLATISTDVHIDNKIQLIAHTKPKDIEAFDKALLALFQ